MAFNDSKDIYFAFGTGGSEHVFAVSGTPGCITNVEWGEDANEYDGTTMGANAEVMQPGIEKSMIIKVSGNYTTEAETYLGALRFVAGKSAVYGPLGNGSGSPKKSATAYVKSFTTKPVAKNLIKFDAEIRIQSGGTVRSTF